MSVYYVDNTLGADENSGLCETLPKRDYTKISLRPGDTLLFKRGSLYRGFFDIKGGDEGAPITYSAYGEGELPTFCGSVDVSSPELWERTERENVWRCTADIPTDVGNFIFNENECTATLVWDKGELANQGEFFDSRFAECNENVNKTVSAQEVLLYSVGNPASVYSHIEVAPYGKRCLGDMKSNLVIENMRFINAGVHGLTAFGDTRNVTVRGCAFENIGGCGWSRERRIRFGNGIEFWIGATNITIERCYFKNIYDSCATHQGPDRKTPPAVNFHVRDCVFDTYSMAAFEYRAQMMISSSFVGNVCRNAGCGFGMLGEPLPRRSEISPEPMGHHIFIWRIWSAPDGGSLRVENNIFDNAPYGSAVYSTWICPEAEAQITFKDNTLAGEYLYPVHYGGKNLDSIKEIEKE